MRLFFAIELPFYVLDKLYASTTNLRKKYPRQKWIRKEALHITLRFLGECPQQVAGSLVSSLTPALQNCPPISIEANGKSGFFPNRRQARIFHVALLPDKNLLFCVKTLNNALEPLGFKTENQHPFRPHITLLRIRHPEPGRELEQFSLPPFRFTTDRISLMQSILKPDGARYKRVHIFQTHPAAHQKQSNKT